MARETEERDDSNEEYEKEDYEMNEEIEFVEQYHGISGAKSRQAAEDAAKLRWSFRDCHGNKTPPTRQDMANVLRHLGRSQKQASSKSNARW